MLRGSGKRHFLGAQLSELMSRKVWRLPTGLLVPYQAEVMADSPLVYFPMDDAAYPPLDFVGSNDMTAESGSPTYQSVGPDGYAISYASGAYHTRALLSSAQSNFTVEYWAYRSGNASGTMFQNGANGGGGFYIEYTNTSGTFRPNLPGVGTLGATGSISATTWTHVVLGRGASSWFLYVNGSTMTSPGTATPGSASGDLLIRGAGATEHRYAHLAYYGTALSQARAQAHYNAMV